MSASVLVRQAAKARLRSNAPIHSARPAYRAASQQCCRRFRISPRFRSHLRGLASAALCRREGISRGDRLTDVNNKTPHASRRHGSGEAFEHSRDCDTRLCGGRRRRRCAAACRGNTTENKAELGELSQNIIINCTGYGARALMNDHDVIAKRGHLVVLRRTLPRQFYFFSGGCANGRVMYVFCRHKHIVVGGTVQVRRDSEAINEQNRPPLSGLWAMRGGCSRAIPPASPPKFSAPPSSVTNSRRLIRSPGRRGRAASAARQWPSILAVWALMTSSSLLDCTTGRSAGCVWRRGRWSDP